MTIAGTLLGEIALRVMIMGGFFLYDQQAAFAEFNKIGSNMAIFVNGLLMIFGADFTGGSLLPGHVRVSDYLISGLLPVLSRLPLVIGMVAAVGIVAVRLLKSQPNTLISLLLFYPVVIVCAAEIFSTEVVDLGAYRYSFPVLICGVTLAAITLVPQAFIRSILTGTLLISVVSFVVTVHSASTNPQFASKDQQALADFLRSRNLTDGYGPYWSASFFTVLTKGEVRIRAISDDGTGMLVPYKWLSESSWYPQPPKDGLRFVVYDSRVEEASAFSRSGIEKALGKPVDDPRVGPYQVMIYPANNPGFSSLSLPQ